MFPSRSALLKTCMHRVKHLTSRNPTHSRARPLLLFQMSPVFPFWLLLHNQGNAKHRSCVFTEGLQQAARKFTYNLLALGCYVQGNQWESCPGIQWGLLIAFGESESILPMRTTETTCLWGWWLIPQLGYCDYYYNSGLTRDLVRSHYHFLQRRSAGREKQNPVLISDMKLFQQGHTSTHPPPFVSELLQHHQVNQDAMLGVRESADILRHVLLKSLLHINLHQVRVVTFSTRLREWHLI